MNFKRPGTWYSVIGLNNSDYVDTNENGVIFLKFSAPNIGLRDIRTQRNRVTNDIKKFKGKNFSTSTFF